MGSIFTDSVIWFLLGLVLLLGELALPGLVLIFFGFGAWITALLCFLVDININVQLAVFLFSSLTGLVFLRKAIRDKYMNFKSGSSNDLEDDYVGHTVTALEDFPANTPGRVDFRGTQWEAICPSPVKQGQTLTITSFKSIRLFVEPLNTNPV